jgi:predicted nucleic acid-binding protein
MFRLIARRRPPVSLVLDSSITLAWVYGDETTPVIRHSFEGIAERRAVVPGLWWLEVANSLTLAVRRKRIEAEFRRAALSDLALLNITTDQQTATQAGQKQHSTSLTISV